MADKNVASALTEQREEVELDLGTETVTDAIMDENE